MNKLIQKVLNKISLSVIQGNRNSTPRIQSYMILFLILIMVISFGVFEYFNFMLSMKSGKPYVISGESILMFGMILSHHLAVLFSRGSSKSKSISDIQNQINEDSSAIENSTTDEDNTLLTDSKTV